MVQMPLRSCGILKDKSQQVMGRAVLMLFLPVCRTLSASIPLNPDTRSLISNFDKLNSFLPRFERRWESRVH